MGHDKCVHVGYDGCIADEDRYAHAITVTQSINSIIYVLLLFKACNVWIPHASR